MLNLLEDEFVTLSFDEMMRTECSTKSDPCVEFLNIRKICIEYSNMIRRSLSWVLEAAGQY